ncbi:filamentous hemagglutinin N-terminal domain-containing protein [Paraburkholderia panacisoli]|uniref:Filamentous hemagglutinin N-terminal domain-containing protein n=1 Tax=Paraburkholderia panacisoli TaxID=2603818 RepID=A0A5B0G7L2_9BURK|nr:filamentous hemagglutinin N-terminal domain-containing protein [Paraburkholderia panacisoli]KAA0997919.1 filamentous hemagglutinin N-terminal domain-containing protein [Paraburkholderia panacisoli]
MSPWSSRRPQLRALRSRHSPRGIAPLIAISLAGLSLAHTAIAGGVLPQGGHYVAGAGTIAGQGDALTVTQPGTTRGVIDWTSFSIGKGNTVIFEIGSGATLNRVTGGTVSTILGNLNATGGVYLINPQGVLVGRSGVISTGGRFVASTLDLPDTAFMNGGTLTLAGFSNGKVVNLGKISSSGGDVFLFSHDVVVNAGSVSAPNGTAEYIAGQQVVLYESSSSRQVFVQVSSRGTVVDRGDTQAAQINLEAADGNIYALAGSGSRIRATGTAMRDGHVWLVAGNGNVTQQGMLAATNADGSGGTVDTIANTLSLRNSAAVQAGLWNVSTPDFTVDSATAGAFVRSLNAGTSVDATATGTNGATGDMTVASSLDWKGPASLSLVAFRNVTIAAATTLRNTGSGNVSLRADAASINNNGSVANQGTIDWSDSTGFVRSFYDMNGSYSHGSILANSAWAAAPYSGLVAQVTGYKLVNSLADLQSVSLDLTGNYALGKNIDASATNSSVAFVSIGDTATPFSGQFDGMGHVIDAFHREQDPAVGLFGVIGPTGVVRNIGMTNSDLGGEYRDLGFGILAGQNQGLVTHAYTTGMTSVGPYEGPLVGGLVGRNDGLIERSWSSASVESSGEIGGLVGANYGTIKQSYATGSVTATTHGFSGGLVGDNRGTVSQSYATGITYGSAQAGGLVLGNSGVVEQSFASGQVQSYCCGPPDSTYFGGIASSNGGTIATNVYWDKETTTRTQSSGAGGQLPSSNGLTTAQMGNVKSFDASWDFSPTGTWAMPASATHPILRWQLAQ